MFKHLVSRITALGLATSFVLFALACGGSDPVPDEQATETQAQESRTVVMYQYRFNPTSVTVAAGTTITFQNRDPEAHNLNIPALNVDHNVDPNQEWSYTFDTRGEFAVGNRFSDGMKLDVTVQ